MSLRAAAIPLTAVTAAAAVILFFAPRHLHKTLHAEKSLWHPQGEDQVSMDNKITEISHDEFHDRPRDRIPTNGTLELTRLCSLKCTHCYIGDARWIKDPEELSTAEVKALLDIMAARGTLWLTFTGGEAMIRRDFRELWLYAKSKGFVLTLFTNATLINESMADFLSQHRPHQTEVSIYGATQATYEKVTGIPGSFRRFLRGVEFIRALGLPWMLKAPVMDDTFPEMSQMQALAKQWGVEFRTDGAINPSIGTGKSGGKAPCSTRLSEEDLAENDLSSKETRAEMKYYAKRMEQEALKPAPESEPLYTCGAGSNMFYVTARGDLMMCVITPHRSGNLKKSSAMAEDFDKTWAGFDEVRKIQRSPDSPCLNCDLTGMCKSCPGFAQLENGDEQSAVAWLCRSTHLKAHKMGLPHRCDIKHFVYTPPKKL